MHPIARRGLLLAAGLPATARAQAPRSWPQRPIRLIVPYAPGGGTDAFARSLAEGLRPILGQLVLVENRAGANGIVGSEAVARGEADGSLFLVDTGAFSMNAHVVPNLPFTPARD
ncbi:MAG TPA: tripartite tricarboxylate transporter substrate-binding protein, partial [Acetobacteraceae bacterium]|nr:tripartite tricarboxylate transporter substrate-binding protein [Acetobacteraceae bacterium]